MSCKKNSSTEETRINPPVRAYIITARIDKKGTNTNAEGTGVLKGTYDEGSKQLSYTLTIENIAPTLITLRSGIKGSAGELVKEIYKGKGDIPAKGITGGLTLTPLQERNLLKGLWFVAMNTVSVSPDISGVLTLKQK
ncbi:CHRD domain-containing protein [Pedobacter lusitanus]|uniref:CHRD domain-containing protein n=1 Tax=Pedobacter lusitanus TaxID=1503925 RepID=UPI0032AFB36B